LQDQFDIQSGEHLLQRVEFHGLLSMFNIEDNGFADPGELR
jgi:hypothetical protein